MNLNISRIRYGDVLYYILFICLFQGIVADYLSFHQINYVCDALLIILAVYKICYNCEFKFRLRKEFVPIYLFIIIVLIGWVGSDFSLIRALWGSRNYGRFFLYFSFCVDILNSEDVERMENLFIKTFPVHILLVGFQYFVEHLQRDNLNGIFGRTEGGNGGLTIYLLIIICIIICRYEYKKVSFSKMVIYFAFALANAALSELKFMFVLTPIIFLWYFGISKRKGRSMIAVLFFAIFLYIGIQVLYNIFPYWDNYFSIEKIWDNIERQHVYSSSYDVGRTAVFTKLGPIISNWAGEYAKYIGIGLGNGDYSSAIPALDSSFFKTYEYLHYTWLSLGYLYVETGYFGTIAYVSFFVVLEVQGIKKYQRNNSYLGLLGTLLPLASLMVLLYNSSLRSNYAYMMFAGLTWQAVSCDININKMRCGNDLKGKKLIKRQ